MDLEHQNIALINIKKFLDKQRTKVEEIIEKVLKSRKPESLYSPGYYVLQGGGKRLRPLLVILSAGAVGGKVKDVYNAAAAVELMHNFTLVHDDIMDNAEKRRGRPSLHVKYDLSTAILAGDSLLSIAYELMLKDCRNNAGQILYAFNDGLIKVCEGQSLDKEFETRNDVSINEYYEMIEKKTASLIETCCKVGALIGGGDKRSVNNLAVFGRYAGLAFQIQDDLLDVIGDESNFGKVTGGDLMEGKKTYMFLQALSKAKGENKKLLLNVIKNKGISKNEIPAYKKIYEELGIYEDAQNEVKRLSNLAIKQIAKIENEEYRNIFLAVTNDLISRNK